MAHNMSHPLSGVRILDLTRLLPGATATMMLADLGADVIKVEDPNGGDYIRWAAPEIDGQSVFFHMNNRGKRAIIINLKLPEGQQTLHRLAKQADVLIESFRPGVMARLNCDYETLQKINPGLVYCALSGWGATGPKAQTAHHDLNYVSAAGLTGAMQTPQVMGGQFADIGGAYIAVAGILAALLRRERAGEGAFVDASLAESCLPFALYNWTEALATGSRPGAGDLSGGQACYRVYITRDDRALSLAALEPRFWENFCRAVDREDLITDYLAPERQPALIDELTGIFREKTLDEWRAALDGVDCCFAPVTPPDRVATDPQFVSRGMLGQFEDGAVWMRSPVRLTHSDPEILNNAPDYGEHTREVLLSAGFTGEEISDLVEIGAVK